MEPLALDHTSTRGSTQGELRDSMNITISTKELRASLPKLVARVRKGARFTVMYRSRPAFEIVPVNDPGAPSIALVDDPLYRAEAVGRSKDGRSSADHDAFLYG